MPRQFAHAAPAGPGTDASSIAALIERRRTACAMLGVTGALLHTGRDFFELFEGPDASVRRLASTISLEPMFREPRVLVDREVDERWYRTWRVGYVAPREFDAWMSSVAIALPRGEPARREIKRFLDSATLE
jgi:hypothetical protein